MKKENWKNLTDCFLSKIALELSLKYDKGCGFAEQGMLLKGGRSVD